MVKLNKIYTKTGDDGTTGLTGGTRVAKHHIRVEAYGTVDEANAAIGLARLHLAGGSAEDEALARIQNDLFDLGADLSTPLGEEGATDKALRITPQQIKRLEQEIDIWNAALEPLTSFVLPGGSAASAYLHTARTIARRAERLTSALQAEEAINPAAIQYLNRLSDHLFVLARRMNDNGAADVLWRPGATR